MNKLDRHIMVIDLKSFFASVECVDRGLDPFTTPLVVADKRSGNGAIALAVTPYLKAQGVPSRGRLFEIPKNIKYMIVPPRMTKYIEASRNVVKIFLDYVAEEDLHVYSIDESFLDVTEYLNYYKMSDYELAKVILADIEKRTGLTATCGIGPNMFLAKVAMDTEAKKMKNGIAHWGYEDVETKLWSITPLSKCWGIGPRMEAKLNALGCNTIGDVAKLNKNFLKNRYGILGEELWYRVNGIDNSIIKDFKHESKEKSFSQSQVLFRDYYNDEVLLIVREMVDNLARRLRIENQNTYVVGFGLTYSKTTGGGFYHSSKLASSTDNKDIIYKVCEGIYDSYYIRNMPIRVISISLGKLVKNEGLQLDIFSEPERQIKDENLERAIDGIKDKFGKNSLLKASSLLPNSTIKERNKKIGGHNAG